MKKVMVVTVHPDDETLGCGGTLLKHKHQNDQIHWLIITHIGEDSGFEKQKVDRREKEIEEVNNQYGFNSLTRYDLPTTKLDMIPKGELIARISKTFNKVKPNVIYLPHYGDAHSDHKIIFDTAYACTKSFRYPFIKEVYTMETLSETNFSAPIETNSFKPNYFVNISSYLKKKIEIMSKYASEIERHPFPRSKRSIEALATLRGSECGHEYAEAFVCLKKVVD